MGLSPPQSFSGPSHAVLMTTFYCLRFETHEPGGPGLRIYIPQEQGEPVIPPGTGFPFRRLLLLAGLRWRYSNPPPDTDGAEHVSSIIACSLVAQGNNLFTELFTSNGCCTVACLHSCYLAVGLHVAI
jgi:hypothetical protein